MYPRASRAILLIAMAVMALAATGCDKEPEQEAARPLVGSAPGEAAGERAASELETPADAAAQAGEGGLRTTAGRQLPRLVDLGRGTCIPCKMMAPILEELKQEYEGKAVVEVIDLRDDSEAAADYAIRVIPTQIFFDSEGEEVWRHEGFLSKDAMIAKFTEMGVPPYDD